MKINLNHDVAKSQMPPDPSRGAAGGSRVLRYACAAVAAVALVAAGGLAYDVAHAGSLRKSLRADLAATVDPKVGILVASENFSCPFLGVFRDRSKLTTKIDALRIHVHTLDDGSAVCEAIAVIQNPQS
jgi:hypothetical protein